MNVALSNEPRHEKTGFLPMRNSFAVTAKLISAFVFATRIVHFLFLLNPKFSSFYAASGTVHVGLCQTWLETPKTGFLASRLIYIEF